MRILILSGNTGEGHNSAARAIAEYFEAQGDLCHVEDGLAYLGRLANWAICKGHVFCYRWFPKIYGAGYRFEERAAQRQPYQKALRASARRRVSAERRKLCDLLGGGEYDAVICTHVFAARIISELRLAGRIAIPAFFLATDYTCSPGVNQLDMDAWFIPHSKLLSEFAGYGIPKEKLVPTGIPVRGMFRKERRMAEARGALGLPQDQRIVLMSLGSMGAGAMGLMVISLVEVLPEDVLLIVICGKNVKLEHALRDFVRSKKLRVMGYVDQMSAYMEAADLFIGKPGGLSTTECVSLRVPQMLINAVPGCETRNMDFLESLGCALSAQGTLALAKRTADALTLPEALSMLSENCAGEFGENAAEKIYEAVSRVVNR